MTHPRECDTPFPWSSYEKWLNRTPEEIEARVQEMVERHEWLKDRADEMRDREKDDRDTHSD